LIKDIFIILFQELDFMSDLESSTRVVLYDLKNIYHGLQGIISLKDPRFLRDIEKSLAELEGKFKESKAIFIYLGHPK